MQELAILKGEHLPEIVTKTTLAHIFNTCFLNNANQTAIVFENTQITYEQLDNWSNECANYLLSKGVQVGDYIGVWHPRGLLLHVAVLGIIKAGATYVPFDEEMPADRVLGVLQDVSAKFCFSQKELNANCQAIQVPAMPSGKVSWTPVDVQYSNYAYILFTSGSTGKPKGIPITHFQICHFIKAESHILKLNNTDKVYQGFSVSFDMWCEETYLTYYAGATLFVANATSAKAIDEVGAVLEKHKITVLHAVPSLLAIIEDEVPTLRLINAGGEACTQQVLQHWSKPNIRFYNSYGPTETTVTSSMIALKPTDTITIGHPLPNYNYAIVNETLQIVNRGELGELIITGAGVGKTYLNLPELTAQKFIPNHLQEFGLNGETIYRTGDAAIINEDGSVAFHGRQDDQVKIRGYRIELGEIETQLSACNNVATAAVCVQKDQLMQDHLIGYVVPTKGEKINNDELQIALQKVLAPYMMPKEILVLDEMPRLPSGKVNRKILPVPPSFLTPLSNTNLQFNDNDGVEEKVIKTLSQFFPDKEITPSKDFFTDLNGHSLLAASFVSKLRKDANIKQATLRDVYTHRPIEKLITEWSKADTKTQEKRTFHPISKSKHIICWIAQTFAMFFIFGFFASQIYLPYLGYYYVQTEYESHTLGIVASIILFCFVTPLLSLIGILAKWILIGKYKEGEYPLWGVYYFKWWFVEKLEGLVQINFLNGTPIFKSYLKSRGCKIGADTQLGALSVKAEDLLEIGKNASISSNVLFNNVVIEDGLIKFSKIKIGDNAYIGSNCIINGNTTIEDWGELEGLSFLPNNTTIKNGEVWCGSPCAKTRNKTSDEMQEPENISNWKKKYYYFRFSLLLFIFPLSILLPLIPVIVLVTNLDNDANDYDFSYFVWIPLLALMYMCLFALQTIIVTRILNWKLKTGTYSIYSNTYFRKWLSDQFLSLSLMIMHPVFATVFISTFFRALGAKVGKYTEISTANNVSHSMLEIGENSFIADNVNLGESDVRDQKLILEKTIIGDRSFVGNSAQIPQGYTLGNDMLIGVLSVPPTATQLQENQNNKDWFGTPSVALPMRQASESFDKSLTFRPSKKIWFARAFVELIRIIMPETIILMASFLFIAFVHDVLVGYSWWQFILLYPLYFICFIGLPCFLVTVILKWIFVGKYKPIQHPMWSSKVWFSEAITSLYESIAVPFFLDHLRGTPWLPIFLRFFGVHIGKRVYLDTTDFTEHDLTTVDDEASLNTDCGPQTHLFEDRVMKMGEIHIGKRSTIGSGTIILYDTQIGENVHIDSLSLVMKGEQLLDNTNWKGNPLR